MSFVCFTMSPHHFQKVSGATPSGFEFENALEASEDLVATLWFELSELAFQPIPYFVTQSVVHFQGSITKQSGRRRTVPGSRWP
jgi:hypothetical protein